MVSGSRAEKAYDAGYGNPLGYVPPLMVAAGKQGKFACKGPRWAFVRLWQPHPSWDREWGRYKCGTARYPALFTEVNNPKIRSWILWAAKR